MKRIFTFLFGFMCVMALHAQDGIMICNFDDVYPLVSSWGDVTFSTADAPAGTLASGQMGVLQVAADDENGSVIFQLDAPFDPHDYVGISLVAQVTTPGLAPAFITKLDQSSDPGNVNQVQDWTYNVRYSGSGDWELINLPFGDAITPALDAKIAADPTFPADQYDKIEIAPGAWDNLPAFTMNIDNIMLMYAFDQTGIPLTKIAAFTILNDGNGTIKAMGVNGNQVSLKVYSTAGQEVAEGLNEVQIGVKGVYIVKATDGKATNIQKVIVH